MGGEELKDEGRKWERAEAEPGKEAEQEFRDWAMDLFVSVIRPKLDEAGIRLGGYGESAYIETDQDYARIVLNATVTEGRARLIYRRTSDNIEVSCLHPSYPNETVGTYSLGEITPELISEHLEHFRQLLNSRGESRQA